MTDLLSAPNEVKFPAAVADQTAPERASFAELDAAARQTEEKVNDLVYRRLGLAKATKPEEDIVSRSIPGPTGTYTVTSKYHEYLHTNTTIIEYTPAGKSAPTTIFSMHEGVGSTSPAFGLVAPNPEHEEIPIVINFDANFTNQNISHLQRCDEFVEQARREITPSLTPQPAGRQAS